MKIGIMTFWWSEDNYGQILQCYALQKYLRDAGHDAYLIRYDPRNDYVKTPLWMKLLKACNPVKLVRFIYHKLEKRIVYDKIMELNKERKFDEFRNKYIKQSDRIYYSYQELVENPPEADAYIVGSDQVWNTFGVPVMRAKNVLNAYFLNFGKPKTKRIAYAASFGKEKLDDKFMGVITPLLKQFDYISVREKSGIDICQQCGVENAEWVADPTMLLDKKIYQLLYKNEVFLDIKKPYCLLYLLSNKCDFPIRKIINWTKERELEIVYVGGNAQYDKYQKTYATIPEWIYLIKHTKYVITNSYHCSIFSLIFEKKLGIISLSGNAMKMNSRFDSLFEMSGLEKRFINDDMSILDTDINWKSVLDSFEKLWVSCKLPNILQKEA